MTNYKRKREVLNDSDDEPPSYGRQILPVADLPDNFSGEPLDGMQYLFLVRRDARQRPDTVRAANPFKKLEVSTLEHSIIEELPAQSFLPTEEWRETFEYRFQNFRKNLKQPTIYVGARESKAHPLIPDKKNREMWWNFITGKPASEWTPKKNTVVSCKHQNYDQGASPRERADNAVDDSLPDESKLLLDDEGEVEHIVGTNAAESCSNRDGTTTPLSLACLGNFSQKCSGKKNSASSFTLPLEEERYAPREPTPELLRLIDERYALHILMYFTHWMNLYLKSPTVSSHLPTESHARWIFALLSRVDDYVSADDTNLLRNLARSCLEFLKYTKQQQSSPSLTLELAPSDKMSEASCWIIIATITGVWKQRDLWMDAEDMLRRLGS